MRITPSLSEPSVIVEAAKPFALTQSCWTTEPSRKLVAFGSVDRRTAARTNPLQSTWLKSLPGFAASLYILAPSL